MSSCHIILPWMKLCLVIKELSELVVPSVVLPQSMRTKLIVMVFVLEICWRKKLEKSYNFNVSLLQKVFNFNFDRTQDSIYQEYLEYGKKIKEFVYDTELELSRA